MKRIKETIIVEGRYDINKLKQCVDAHIVETSGFGIFNDKEKRELIAMLAKKRGTIVLTDSDNAGRLIRNHLKNILASSESARVIHIYSPTVFGKEKRKPRPSKEGKLGVEGIDADQLTALFERYGILLGETERPSFLDRQRLYSDGLFGAADSAEKRRRLAKLMELPDNLSTKALADAINSVSTEEEYLAALLKL